MDASEAKDLLSRVKYKPNVHMMIDQRDDFTGVRLVITADVPDVYSESGELTVVEMIRTIGSVSSEHFYTYLAHCLREFEIHEQRENLRWVETGLPIDDPHAPIGGRL